MGGDLKRLGFRLPTTEKRRFFIFFQRLQYENIPKINDMLGHHEVKGGKKASCPERLYLFLFFFFLLLSDLVCCLSKAASLRKRRAPGSRRGSSVYQRWRPAPRLTSHKDLLVGSCHAVKTEEGEGSETLLDGAKTGNISH